MDAIDIRVKKNKKGDLIEGPFFVAELSIDEVLEYYQKVEKSQVDSRALLAQAVLRFKDGKHVFKPQQVNLIHERLGGVFFLKVVYVANQLNPVESIAELVGKYEKNSVSDQTKE